MGNRTTDEYQAERRRQDAIHDRTMQTVRAVGRREEQVRRQMQGTGGGGCAVVVAAVTALGSILIVLLATA